jgi:hypothetical protein
MTNTNKQPRKQLTVTIVNARGIHTRLRYRAPSGRAFSAAGIDSLLASCEVDIRKHSPAAEFRLVALRDGNYNIIEIAPPASVEVIAEAVHA